MDALLEKLLATMTPGAYGIGYIAVLATAWAVREWRATQKLSSDDRLARRDGYAKQVEMLMQENRSLGEDMRKLRDDYDKYRRLCQQETDALRENIMMLQGEVAGYKRRLDTQSMQLAKISGMIPEAKLSVIIGGSKRD